MTGNGTFPHKWNPLQNPQGAPALHSGMDASHLPIQPNIYKQMKESPLSKPKPPGYPYDYPGYPRVYSPMQYPVQTPYSVPPFQMNPHLQIQRRPAPDWGGHWAQEMAPMMDPLVPQVQPQDAWGGEWAHPVYPPHMYNHMAPRNHPLNMRRDTPTQLKPSHSPVPPNLAALPMNDQLSPARGHQGSRGNIAQVNSDFPSFSPTPLSQSHLSPSPVAQDVSHTSTSSLPDLQREVSNPLTPRTFRHPGLDPGNSRQETPPLARQHTPTPLPMGASPGTPAPRRPPGKRKGEHVPFEQWVREHGLYPEFQRENANREAHDFYYQLLSFLYTNQLQATPYATPTRAPLVAGEEVNLFRLHKAVEAMGGVRQVCERKEWKKIFQMLNYQSKGTTGIKSLKQIYLKWLLPFLCSRRGEPVEPILEMCRSVSRAPRKQHNNQSADSVSVTSPAAPSEESQEVPESPVSMLSGFSTSCSPAKIKPPAEERATSSDTKLQFDHFNDNPYLSDPFLKSEMDQTSPPFSSLNRAKSHPDTSHLDTLKPKMKTELSDPSDGHGPSPYFYSEQYHSMMPHRPPYHPHPHHPAHRIMYPVMPPQRWSHTPKQEEWYPTQRPIPAPDTSRTQTATPVSDSKPRAPREKPASAPAEAGEKQLVGQKRAPESGAARPALVELTTPIPRKRKKHPPNMNMTDPMHLTMALRSGVLTDTAWALDYLTILLNHNDTRELFLLSNAPGLLDALVACWMRCLLDMFPGEISLPPQKPEPVDTGPTPPPADTDLPPQMRQPPAEPPAPSDTSLPPSVRYLRTPFSDRCGCVAADVDEREELEGEDEVLRPPENVLFLHPTPETQLGHMTICISNLIRCLSFIQGNELILAQHHSLLSLIGQLLLLRHSHPPRIQLRARPPNTSDTSDSQEDCDSTGDEYVLDTVRCEWWWMYLEYVREDIFVLLCNMAGALDFSFYPSHVAHSLLHALTHWFTCPSSMCQDPLPHLSNTSWLSPKRLVLECLSKLSVLPSNVDYILGTPSQSELRQLVRELSKWSINRKDIIARQFVFVLLYNMCGTPDMCPHYAIARQVPLLQVLLECVESATPLPPANPPPRATKGATPQEEFMILNSLRRRAASTLLRLSQHPDNLPLFLDIQPRLLALVCPASAASDTFKNDPHLRPLVLEILSHLSD